MAPVYQGAGALASTTTASLTANFDAGAADTDLVFCIINSSLSTLTLPSVPTGWTDLFGRVVPTDHAAWVLAKVIGAGETNVPITLSGATTWAAQCFRWNGHDLATPIGDTSVPSSFAASTTITSAPLTAQGNGSTIAQFITVDLSLTYSEPPVYFTNYFAGYTERAKSIAATPEFLVIGAADGDGPGAGGSVTTTTTQAVSDQYGVFLVEILGPQVPVPIVQVAPFQRMRASTRYR